MLVTGFCYKSPDKLLLHICHISPDSEPASSIDKLPSEIQSILTRYPLVLEQPMELPPSRPCNHTIPLVPGAQSVFIRPYRYPPALKDEIERQVQEMLAQGLIRPNSSPFSSSVLLVKKKDGSYQFRVNFHQLNAITA